MCKYLTIIQNSKQLFHSKATLPIKYINTRAIDKENNKLLYQTQTKYKGYYSWDGSFVQRMILNSKDNRDDIFLL